MDAIYHADMLPNMIYLTFVFPETPIIYTAACKNMQLRGKKCCNILQGHIDQQRHSGLTHTLTDRQIELQFILDYH